jgi:alpha-beta hydrolase superfamily lysophospholipase
VATPRLAREFFVSPALPEAELKRYATLIQDEAYIGFLDMLALRLPHPRRVQTPLLVLGAERDAIFTPREVRATARAYHTEATIFSDMAHDMMLEPDWAKVADHILGWLRARGL